MRSDSVDFSFLLRPEDQIKGVLLDQFQRHVSMPKDVISEHQVHDVIEKFYSALTVNSKKNFHDNFEHILNDIFSQQKWVYSMVCGFACIWEIDVKILASKLGVEVKVPYEERNRKSKNTKTLVYKKLGIVIEDINRLTNKSLTLELQRISDLRSALIHGNFNQLRRFMSLPRIKPVDSHRGNVFTMRLSEGKKSIVNLSDDLDDDTREGTDVFGWLVEGTNSRLLEDVLKEFEDSVRKLHILFDFSAHSFGECEGFFQKVAIQNKQLTKDEVEKIKKHYREHFRDDNFDTQKVLDNYNSCFNFNIFKE